MCHADIPSVPQLGNQRPWYVQPRLCDWAYKISRATYRKEKGIAGCQVARDIQKIGK